MQTGLEGKPWWYGAIAGAFIGGVVFVGAWFYLLEPKRAEIRRKEARYAELQVKIQEGRAAKQKLPQFREEVRRLELELDKLLRILPARRNTPDLMRRIRALTEQGDFELLRFTPGNFADREFFAEWPISIALQGTYHNLALFFDRISRFSRIINIENLNVQKLSGRARPTHTISASFMAKTFVYKESVPPPAEPAAAPAARRRPAGAPAEGPDQ
jgi:Tfp pilus assembly protein PilO